MIPYKNKKVQPVFFIDRKNLTLPDVKKIGRFEVLNPIESASRRATLAGVRDSLKAEAPWVNPVLDQGSTHLSSGRSRCCCRQSGRYRILLKVVFRMRWRHLHDHWGMTSITCHTVSTGGSYSPSGNQGISNERQWQSLCNEGICGEMPPIHYARWSLLY